MTAQEPHDELAAAIDDGSYVVSSLDVADAILEKLAMTDIVREFLAREDQSGSIASDSDDANC
ncbi:MAG: hypothetical protein ACR2N7_08840 [Acidimicrobiia bacterium]